MASLSKEITTIKCIYCQDIDGDSREHIIPDALLERVPNEAWIIQKGSCGICQKIINPIETDVIKNLYKGIRPSLGIKKGKIEVFQIGGEKVYSPDAYFITQVIFAMPQILVGSNNPDGKIRLRQFYFTVYDPNRILKTKLTAAQLGEHQIGSMDFSPANLMKMLAKIAYGFGVFQYGELLFKKSFLPEIILGRQNEMLGKYIGSILKPEADKIYKNSNLINLFQTKFHNVQIREYENKIIAMIEMFHEHGSNSKDSYIVVLNEI